MVVCNNQIMCADKFCGGRTPHNKCEECGNCGLHPEAFCIDESKMRSESIKVLTDCGYSIPRADMVYETFIERRKHDKKEV